MFEIAQKRFKIDKDVAKKQLEKELETIYNGPEVNPLDGLI